VDIATGSHQPGQQRRKYTSYRRKRRFLVAIPFANSSYDLHLARVGGLQSQSAKGEAAVRYRHPLARKTEVLRRVQDLAMNRSL
jgi:hypothetical protein